MYCTVQLIFAMNIFMHTFVCILHQCRAQPKQLFICCIHETIVSNVPTSFLFGCLTNAHSPFTILLQFFRWALPDQMAQAGFFQSSGSADAEDRALCFICRVCLVCWESTDEPWAEHERHSENCPFVKGQYTHNIPIRGEWECLFMFQKMSVSYIQTINK